VRLLLAEDSPDLGPRLKSALERQGYAVDLARDGPTAEVQADTVTYDAVILDLGLPGRDGLTVLENWRRRGNRVPVIILTARSEWHEKVRGLKAGADDYLPKPFHEEELLARIRAVVRRALGSVQPQLSVEGVTLDEDTQQVMQADGHRIALTAAEFRLLRYMMLHPGRILSKESLFDHVYGFEGEAQSNVIEVYVNRLRAKIGRHLIRTRRGQGYVLGRERP
jgi:DNA-binding response OmpR family regulator